MNSYRGIMLILIGAPLTQELLLYTRIAATSAAASEIRPRHPSPHSKTAEARCQPCFSSSEASRRLSSKSVRALYEKQLVDG